MKRIALILLLGLLWGCSASVVEIPDETTMVAEEASEDVFLIYHFTHLDLVRPLQYSPGERLTLNIPVRQGYEFLGWYLDEALTIPFDYDVMPNSDVNLYPRWLRFGEPHPDLEDKIITLYDGEIVLSSGSIAPLDVCKIENSEYFGFGRDGVGFPLPDYTFPKRGNIRIAVVYFDFLDYRWEREESKYSLTEFLIQPIQDYYDVMSRGQISFEWVVYEQVISLSKNVSAYNITRNASPNSVDIKSEIHPKLKSVLDYDQYDAVLFGINPDVPFRYSDVSSMSRMGWPGSEFYIAIIGMDSRSNPYGHLNIAHEFGHMFGIPDLYSEQSSTPIAAVGPWSLMSSLNWYINELLIWERWLIGWIEDEEVSCIDNNNTYYLELSSTLSDTDHIKSIVINRGDHFNVVIEMRDYNQYCQFCNKGVLVYTVNSTLPGQKNPINVLKPTFSEHWNMKDALLTLQPNKNSLIYEDIRIEVVDETDDGLIVKISSITQ